MKMTNLVEAYFILYYIASGKDKLKDNSMSALKLNLTTIAEEI